MTATRTLAAALVLALASPGAVFAQADHGHARGDAAPAAPDEATRNGGMHGGMMDEGSMSPEMQEAMRERMHEHMQEVMLPMLRDIMREIMAEMQVEGADPPAGHGAHDDQDAAPAGSPATEAYRAANIAMHEAMDIDYTDDPDIDFARGMIGHHQGAIDMARIVLEHGEDPELHQLAEEIIEAQEAEVEILRDWLAEHAE